MSDFIKLIKRMGIQRKYIILLLLRSPFDAFRTWMTANLMKSVFLCLEIKNSGVLPGTCAKYGLICAILFVYNGIIWSNYAAFSAETEVRLQQKMLEKLLRLPLKRIEEHFSGEWITKLNSDIQAAFTMMNGPLNMPHLAVAILNTAFSSFLLFRSSFLFLAASWILIFLLLFVNHKIVLESVSKLKEASQKALSENTSAIKPLITDADTIFIYHAGELMLKKCAENSRQLMKINMKMHVRIALSNVSMRLFGIGGYLIILLIGFGLIYYGTMAFSDVVYCLQIRSSISGGALMIITCLNNLKTNSACIKRINAVFKE